MPTYIGSGQQPSSLVIILMKLILIQKNVPRPQIELVITVMLPESWLADGC